MPWFNHYLPTFIYNYILPKLIYTEQEEQIFTSQAQIKKKEKRNTWPIKMTLKS